jgi:hypothetical protein
MATCFICGCSGANHRREVYTGRSSGWFWSRRSYGQSYRSYYGLRTVCGECAARIDRNHTRNTWISILIIGFIILFVIGKSNSTSKPKRKSSYSLGINSGRVVAFSGLNIRKEGSINSPIILKIPYDAVLTIIATNGPIDTIQGKVSKWYNIEYEGSSGWAWGPFIEVESN